MEQPATPAMQVGLALEPPGGPALAEAAGKRAAARSGACRGRRKDYFRAHVQRKWWGKRALGEDGGAASRKLDLKGTSPRICICASASGP